MRKKSWGLLALAAGLLLGGFLPRADAEMTEPAGTPPAVEEPEVVSEAATLIDSETGTVLYAKNADEQLYPASITKIVTGIIALENTKPDETVTVSKEARNEDGTRIYLEEGEQLPMGKLLYGMLMNSGNDAATAVAEHIDGSKEKFAERMNRFVQDKIGTTSTHFVNPSGLPDPAQVTTAADMAKIASYAMKNETFRKIVSTKTMPWDGQVWKSELVNHNRMLWDYEGANGVKNGYTTEAGNTLVTSAVRDGMELIVVVLQAPGNQQAYDDTRKLLDYGFAAFAKQTVISAGQTFEVQDGAEPVQWQADQALTAVVRKDETPETTVRPDGQVTLRTKFGDQPIGRLTAKVEQKTAKDVHASSVGSQLDSTSDSGGSTMQKVVWYVWLFQLLLFALWFRLKLKRRRRY